MPVLSEDKHKNDAPRRDYWWLLVVGFVLGAVVMALIMNQRPQQPTVTYNPPSFFIEATGTAMALRTPPAVNTIQGPQVIDPIQLTATALITEATQRAEAIAAGS